MLDKYRDTGRDRRRYRHGPPEASYQQGTPTPPGSQTLTDIARVLHISFALTDEADSYIGYRAAGMADLQQIRALGFHSLEYYRTFAGTPWAAPWLATRQAGLRLVVLSFEEHYARN